MWIFLHNVLHHCRSDDFHFMTVKYLTLEGFDGGLASYHSSRNTTISLLAKYLLEKYLENNQSLPFALCLVTNKYFKVSPVKKKKNIL